MSDKQNLSQKEQLQNNAEVLLEAKRQFERQKEFLHTHNNPQKTHEKKESEVELLDNQFEEEDQADIEERIRAEFESRKQQKISQTDNSSNTHSLYRDSRIDTIQQKDLESAYISKQANSYQSNTQKEERTFFDQDSSILRMYKTNQEK